MQVLEHPQSGVTITGSRLAPGAVLQQGDQYDSTTGVWEPCTSGMVGIRLGNTETVWVRPDAELSAEAQQLLLAIFASGHDSCIAKRDGMFYLIPHPEWNWDGRFDRQHVLHPPAVQELADLGHLAEDHRDISNGWSDYAMVRPHDQNHVFVLTPQGKHEGQRLLAS